MRVKQGTDWAFGDLISQEPTRDWNAESRSRILCVHVTEQSLRDAYVRRVLGEGIRTRAGVLGGPVWVISDNLHDETSVVADWIQHDLRLRHRGLRAIPFSGVNELLTVLDQVEEVVTTKLHVGIVATAFGCTVWSFALHPKIERFYRQVGVSEQCLPLWKDGFKKASADEFLERMQGVGVQVASSQLERVRQVHGEAVEALARFLNG